MTTPDVGLAAHRAVLCPTCAAGPGVGCLNVTNGQPLPAGHHARAIASAATAAAAAYAALVRAVPCPSCAAGPGQRCLNSANGQPISEQIPGHPARVRAATPRDPA